MSQVKLECLGIADCHGKLVLSAQIAANVKGKKKKPARTVSLGAAGFSIPGDETKTVKVKLNAAGRALLSIDHGHLNASLAILESSPSPSKTLAESVQLVQRRAHGRGKK